jgi:hypothetical protein
MEPASDNPRAPTSRLRQWVRTLRNLTALGLLTLSLGVLALWVRSFGRTDYLTRHDPDYHWTVSSWAGRLSYLGGPGMVTNRGNITVYEHSCVTQDDIPPNQRVGSTHGTFVFAFHVYPSGGMYLAAPNWVFALTIGALAFALKPKPRLKFSLADLLVLMTFSAVLLAGVAGLSRLGS